VLLWTPDKEGGEYVEAGMTMRNRPLAYWLDYVRTLAGTQCPVLVVQSQCDDASCDRTASIPAAHGFESLQEVKFSAKEDRGLETLKGQLQDAARTVLTRYKGWTIGVGRAEVRTKLRDMLEKDQKQTDPSKRRHRVLSFEKYEKVCARVNRKRAGSVSNPKVLLDYLHQTGVVFYKQGLFGDRIVLDQEWALEAIYTLFHREDVLPYLVQDRGRFTRTRLSDRIWSKRVDGKGPYSESEQQLFLDMMQQCGICFRANRDYDEQHRALEAVYIAPELLPEWKEIREREYHWTAGRTPDAKVTLRYRFLHEGVFRGLVSKIGQQAREGAHYGKQGCGFYDRKAQTTVMVEAIPRETVEHPGAGELVLQAWGCGARELLETIFKEVPRVAVVPPEVECSWEENGEVESERTLTPGPSPGGRGEPEGVREAGLEKLDTVKQRVYLSYAWGEDGDVREQVAAEVIAKLTEWGYEAVYDKKKMRAGDRISEFMKEIARGHKIVVVVSAKYLRSPYCVNELHSIFIRHLRDAEEFLGRVVPVVIADAKIRQIKQRVTHVKYWKREYDKHRGDDEHLGEDSRKLLRRYAEWGQDLEQILYLISDQLSPQIVRELSDLDFEAIRRMLGPSG
jgi:internalin A